MTAAAALVRTRTVARPLLVPGVLLFSLVLIQAPVLLGDRPPIAAYPLTLLPFCVALTSMSMRRPRWAEAGVGVALALLYVALVSVAALRASYFDVLTQNSALREVAQFTIVAAVGAFAFLREPRAEWRAAYLRALCWAPATYLLVNVGLYFAGVLPVGRFTASAEQPATMLHIAGLPLDRIQFPMSGGPLGIAPTAVVACVICAMLWLRRERPYLAAGGVLLSLYVIFMIDSRGALMFALLAIVIVYLARRRGLGWVAMLLPVMPVILVFALTGLAETDAGVQLDRGGAESLGTGTGRTVVWGEVIDVFDDPNPDNVFGYGQLGQVQSGASIDYAYLFRNDANPLTHSAHNVVFQNLLDIGWVGLLCFLILATMVLRRLEDRARDPYYWALFAGTLSLLLLGIVQADPTPTHPDSFIWWLLVIFAALRARERPDQTERFSSRST